MEKKEKIKKEVRNFIAENFTQGKENFKDSDSLFENNILDSFGILELSSFVEKQFGVTVYPSDVTVDNFNSIDTIVNFIISK